MTHEAMNLTLGLGAIGSMMVSGLLFVIFGQVTVRKLRKHPATRSLLGVELLSGWDIVNAASALSRPDWLTRRLERGALRDLFADSRALKTHTSRLDRGLARACYWGMRFAVAWIVVWLVAIRLF
jgi:hypothetical protein